MSTLLVVGGVAAGMSAASKAKRLDPSLNVIALEKSPYVSYGACGMPYNLLRPDDPMESMVVITPEQFRTKRGIDAKTNMEVLEIDAHNHTVKAKNLVSGELSTFQWDSLVYSTGAHSIKPAWPGIELEGVLTLRDLVDGKAVKDYLARKAPKRAAIIGGGLAALGIAAALVLNALNSNIALYVTPSDVFAGKAPKLQAFRIGGLVKEGSLRRDNLTVHFVMTDMVKDIPVAYTGILPDLFKEGKGAVVQVKQVTEGEMSEFGNHGLFASWDFWALSKASFASGGM